MSRLRRPPGVPLATLCVALAIAPGVARPAAWTLERAADARLTVDDNPDFAPSPPRVRTSLRAEGTAGWTHDDESERSRFDLRLAGERDLRGSAGRAPVESTLAASQLWRAPLGEWRLGGALQHEQVGNGDPGDAVEQRLGRGTRRRATWELGLTRALHERLSVAADLRADRTAYGSGIDGAQDFESRSVTARAAWRASERSTLTAGVGGVDFRTTPAALSRSRSVQWTLAASHGWSPTVSLSLLLGRQHSEQRLQRDVLVCPLPAAFCEDGRVLPVRVRLAGTRRDDVSLFSAAWQWSVDERRSASLGMTRTQSPSGAGVPVTSHRVSAATAQALSPTLSWTASIDLEQLRYDAATGADLAPRPTLAVAGAALRWQLAERVSLQAGLRWARSGESRSGLSAQSRRVTVSIRIDAPRAWSGR